MPSDTPFVDRTDGTLDTDQILVEAIPLAKLIGLFALVGFVPFALAFAIGPSSAFALPFSLLAQFVFAVGAGIVLIYAVARGIALAGE